jgi:hypothetical protein
MVRQLKQSIIKKGEKAISSGKAMEIITGNSSQGATSSDLLKNDCLDLSHTSPAEAPDHNPGEELTRRARQLVPR